MKEVICDNCGSSDIVEVNGIAQCQYCRKKFPDMSLSRIGIDEELRDKEIRRLVDEGGEPKLGLLDDEDVLKYAPKSKAGAKIRIKRGESTIQDKFYVQSRTLILIWISSPFVGVLVAIMQRVLFDNYEFTYSLFFTISLYLLITIIILSKK